MSLRKRAIFISIISVILSVGILYLASQLFLVKSYEQIEEQETIDDLQRVANALQDHIQSLEKIAIGYAQWDDTRDFIQNSKPDYVENNFTEGVYEDTGLDIAIFVDTQGKIVFKKAVNRQTTSEVGVPISLINQLKPDSVLLNQSDVDSSVAGILPLPEGNLIVISLPVSNNQGISPIYGYMVWGRFIDEEMIQQIDESTRLKATIVAYDLPSFGADFESAKDELTSARPFLFKPLMQRRYKATPS